MITGVQKTFCYRGIPFSHQNRCIAGGIKAVSPSRLFVDRERALVIASVDVTIGSHIFSQIEWIAQFRLVNDLDPPALSCYYRDHLRIFSAYLPLAVSNTLLAASNSNGTNVLFLYYYNDPEGAFVALKQTPQGAGNHHRYYARASRTDL